MAQINFRDFFDFGDTSEPQRAIQIFDALIDSLQKLSQEANSTSSAYKKSIDEVRNSSRQLSNSIEQVEVSAEGQRETLDQTSRQVSELRQQNETLNRGYQQSLRTIRSLETQINRLRQARKQATQATLDEREAVRAANQEGRLVARIKRAQEGSIEQLRARLGLVTIEWKNLSEAERENTQRGQRLVRVKRELTDQLKRLEGQTGDTRRNVGNYTESIVEALKQTGGFATQIAGLNQGLGRGNQGIGGALNGIAGILPRIGPLGAIIGAAVGPAAGLATQTAEINRQLGETRNLTRLTGLELRNLVASIRATSNTFDQEYNEVLRASNALARTFGITQSEAVDLINQGFIRGADLSGELLDSLREYSVQFRAAGLDAQTLVDIIAQSTEEGIFSDKGIDAIKEATLRLRELPAPTRAALARLGLDANQIQRDLETGTRSIRDVIADVSVRLGELGPQSSAVGQAIADIFGGPGEDAGLQFLLTLRNLNRETGDYRENLNDAQRINLEYLESQTEVEEALVSFGTSFESVGTQVRTFFNNIIAESINALNALGRAFGDTGTFLKSFRTEVQRTQDLNILREQLQTLQKDLENPGPAESFRRFIANAFGGRAGVARRIAEGSAQVAILQDRIKALEEEEAINQKTTEANMFSVAVRQVTRDMQRLQTQIERLDARDTISETLAEVELLREAFDRTFGEGFFETEEAFRGAFDRINDSIEAQAELFERSEREKTEITEREEERRQQIRDGFRQLQDEAIVSGFEIFQNNLAAEQEALRNRFDAELEAAGDNQNARAAIERRFQQEDLRIRQRQARADKAAAIFSIAVNTARGIVAALASVPPNVPLSLIIGGIGAVQAAAVASRPVPQFFRGKEPGEYEGPATWAEKGFELLERDGKLYRSPDEPSFINVKRRDRIYDHERSKQILLEKNYIENGNLTKDISSVNSYNTTIDNQQVVSELKRTNNLLGKTRVIEKGFDQHGAYYYIREQNRQTKIRGSYKCRKN